MPASGLEKTNEVYTFAIISEQKCCEFLNRQYGTDYISVMLINFYGSNGNYHQNIAMYFQFSSVVFYEAKKLRLKEGFVGVMGVH